MNFTLNIISWKEEDGTYSASCPQFNIAIPGAPSPEEAIGALYQLLPSVAIDKRNDLISELSGKSLFFEMSNIPVVIDEQARTHVFSDTPAEMQRKLDILYAIHETNQEDVIVKLVRPCERDYVLSLKDKDLLEESNYITAQLTKMMGMEDTMKYSSE